MSEAEKKTECALWVVAALVCVVALAFAAAPYVALYEVVKIERHIREINEGGAR